MLSVLAQAAPPEVSGWFGLLGIVVFVAGSVITALLANRARITANAVQQQVTPNGGSSAHDQIMRAIDSVRVDVRQAVVRDDERFDTLDGRLVGIERRLERVEQEQRK